MKCIVFIVTLFSFQLNALDQNELDYPWSKHAGSDEKNLARLLKILSGSPTGNKLIIEAREKAKNWGKTLFDVLKVGEGSLTDTTILRQFSPHNALEVIHQSVSVVMINHKLNTYDAVLDLAHELTHFIFREDFNPYIDSFSVDAFVKKTIEGRGGEIEAFIVECKVNKELFQSIRKKRSGCEDVMDNGTFSSDKTKEFFYRMGPYYHRFFSEVKTKFGISKDSAKQKFPGISKKAVEFYSSAHSVPYPLAALFEYSVIVSTACKNDHKRLQFIQSGLRKPSSKLNTKQYLSLVDSFEQRCGNYL